MYVIILKLPDGINFYEGKIKYGIAQLDSWDTDINYARVFKKKIHARKCASELKLSPAQNLCKVRSLSKWIKQEKQEYFLKFFHKSLLV